MRNIKAALKKLQKLRSDDSGQGMTEYIIIVALIAILSIGFVSAFGDNIRGLFAASSTALSGRDNIRTSDFTREVRGDQQARERKLGDFDKYNQAP